MQRIEIVEKFYLVSITLQIYKILHADKENNNRTGRKDRQCERDGRRGVIESENEKETIESWRERETGTLP